LVHTTRSAACPKIAERPPQRHYADRISAGQYAHNWWRWL